MNNLKVLNHKTSLQKLTDLELESELKKSVIEENKIKTQILHLLAEVERRRLYSKNHPSLFEYCIRVLKYSSGAAQRRIDTMRAMRLLPEIEPKILSGELNFTAVSQAQSFFRQEAKIGKAYSVEDKRGVLLKLENKSTRECAQELIAISPLSVPQERRRELTPDKTELKVVLDKGLVEKLDKIKALVSHKNPYMNDVDLLNYMADLVLQKIDPEKKVFKIKAIPTNSNSLPALAVNKNLRYIPATIKSEVWFRDKGKCSHPHCNSRHFLEFDHKQPIYLGGQTTVQNLRLLCRAHNTRSAIDQLGFKMMNRFMNAR